MKTVIHVNQHRVRANRADGGHRPVFTAKAGAQNLYSNSILIYDRTGEPVGRFRYEPDHPLSCGAHVWFETYSECVSIENPQSYSESNSVIPITRNANYQITTAAA